MSRIYEVTELREGLFEELNRLMPQLNPTLRADRESLARMVAAPLCHLFVAEVEGAVAGMLTLALYDTLEGRRAWIEDVVVDECVRGAGLGRRLLDKAREEAEKAGAVSLSLTSSAHRVAAHALYRKEGFQEVATTLFRLNPQK